MSWNCATGAQALASCICLKSGMRGRVSSTLTSDVKAYCSSTATDDVTSAMAVFDFYCSAAEKKVVATGAESVSETQPSAMSRTGAKSLNASKTTSPSGTGGGGGGGGSDGSKDTNTGGGGGGSGGGNKTAIIAASVLGGVVAIGIVAAIVFFVRHRRQKLARGEQITGPPDEFPGKSELDGKSDWAGRIGSPGSAKPMPELYTPSHSPRPELHGGGGGGGIVSELGGPHQAPRTELQGDASSNHSHSSPPPQHHQPSPYGVSPSYSQQHHPQSPYGGRGPGYEVSPASAQGHPGYAHGWQSGPVESYELDSNLGRRNQ
ncbi:hypothetical protein JDV02_004621 [Purpureocillium takamizusanense]|uniref:Uncharacterized protein n=1 Tax=Purpureocillium takamizusanense TaxID=2060973 RepID=A0A9Q8VA61_9HYPO|nr:uncharacterized protein JDV02_004621 [Purpureocillium takamizusanense]UNI18348.1 hypothetical protein JDV02_004621 [Purpureocillium takamizusanense]